MAIIKNLELSHLKILIQLLNSKMFHFLMEIDLS